MEDSSTYLYNSILNATACINIPVKLFTLYIIVTKTPRHLRRNSFFILDVLWWNTSGNVLLAITHPLPVYYGRCYRLQGPLSAVFESEMFGRAMSLAISVCILHWAVAIVLAFFYRYLSFVHPKLAAKIKPTWAFWLCALAHVIAMVASAVMFFFANASSEEYPSAAELPNRHLLFCFAHYGWKRTLLVGSLLAIGILGVAVIVTLAFLFFQRIGRSEGIVHAETLKIQRRLIWNLIILTSIVLLIGTTPLVVSLLVVTFPFFPQANAICAMNIIICANHGTIYAIATLILFKPYRQAVSKMLRRVIGRFSGKKVLFVKVSSV